MNRIGFIGAGNMGAAILGGIIESKSCFSENIFVCDKIVSDYVRSLKVNICSLKETVESSDCIVLAVKPSGLGSVLEDIKSVKDYDKKLYISIAAGFKIENIEKILGNAKIIRVMPNICLKALEGMTVMASNEICSSDDTDTAEKIFSTCGKTAWVKEELIDGCTAINGSGPAYVFMFMEALADAAVKNGINRETANLLACQTVLGSAKLMMETGVHPGKLKDMVCSPGGTTIEAVAKLEEKGFRDAVISAVDACVEKAVKMSKHN